MKIPKTYVKVHRRVLKEPGCDKIGGLFTGGFQNSGLDQVRQDRVQVISKFISVFEFPTDLVHL